MKIFGIFDYDKIPVGYVTDEDIAKEICDKQNKKLYPFSYGESYNYYELNLMNLEEINTLMKG